MKATTLQIKRSRFLDKTISRYTLNTRGIRETREIGTSRHDLCSYSKGCAIGAELSKRARKRLDKGIKGDSSIKDYRVFKTLPKHLRFLGRQFLGSIQCLHDGAQFWNETGLSPEGKDRVEYLREVYELM